MRIADSGARFVCAIRGHWWLYFDLRYGRPQKWRKCGRCGVERL